MRPGEPIIRPLGPIEQAFTISNEAIPLSVACVLHLTKGPTADALSGALQRLQDRHLLLQAGIADNRGGMYFRRLSPVPPIPVFVVERSDADAWRGAAEEAINTKFDKSGPLMRCWYLPDTGGGPAELIVSLHHAMIDGISARLILHELLSLCGGVPLPAPHPSNVLAQFPADYRGLRFLRRMLPFAGRQFLDELQYRRHGAAAPIPEHSHNAVLTFRLSPETSRLLSVRIGREGLSLNSVLLAAITKAVLRFKHAGREAGQVRVISFADLRDGVVPPVSRRELGCYVSMVRMSVPVTADPSLSALAAQIQRALFRAGRRGEVYLMSGVSKHLMQMVLRMQNQRLGASALSFIGKLDLEPAYGDLRLHDVNAFITNNRFGPEFSAFGKILFGAIGLDFTYLTAETSAEQARQMLAAVREDLEAMANTPYL